LHVAGFVAGSILPDSGIHPNTRAADAAARITSNAIPLAASSAARDRGCNVTGVDAIDAEMIRKRMRTNLEVERLLLRIDQVVQAASISRSGAYKMIATGKLPVVHIRGYTPVLSNALRQWITQPLAARPERA
jgi:predicted DNA-binding transcriptional regulator AlpA